MCARHVIYTVMSSLYHLYVSHFLLQSKGQLIMSLLPSSPMAARKHNVVPVQHGVSPTLCLQSNRKNIPSALNLWCHPRKSYISFMWSDTKRVKGSPFRRDQLPAHFGSHYLTSERCCRKKKDYTNEQRMNQGRICQPVYPRKRASKQKNNTRKSLSICIEWSLSTVKRLWK